MNGHRITLRGLGQAVEGQVWESNERLRVGRLDGFEIILDEASISREHAEVVYTEDGWAVQDLGSTNGTYLNGARVGRAHATVREGDIIQFGKVCTVVSGSRQQSADAGHGIGPEMEAVVAVHEPWEESVDQLGRVTPGEAGPSSRLATLIRIGRDFYNCGSLDSYLDSMLWSAAEFFDARHAAFILSEQRSGRLQTRAALAVGKPVGRATWANSLPAQEAFEREQTILFQPGGNPSEGGPGADAGEEPRSMICAALLSPHGRLGVLCLARVAEQQAFRKEDVLLAHVLAQNVSASIASLDRLLERQRELCFQTLTILTDLIGLRVQAHADHKQRVTDYALLLAEELNLPEAERHYLQMGTPLHDLGKVGISDFMLQKAGPLTAQEAETVKGHFVKGATLLESVPFLAPLVPMLRSCHERWDGTGYPDGLAGERIPMLARIVALADAFDAMTSDRPYRGALSLDEAFAQAQGAAGAQFDPGCVAALLRLRPRIEKLFKQRCMLTRTVSSEELSQVLGNIRPRRSSQDKAVAR